MIADWYFDFVSPFSYLQCECLQPHAASMRPRPVLFAAILGVNRIVERPTLRGGSVVARQLMNLSSSFDHRVVDGMDAARFIQAIRALLEAPALLLAA